MKKNAIRSGSSKQAGNRTPVMGRAGVPFNNTQYKAFQKAWYGAQSGSDSGILATSELIRNKYKSPSDLEWGFYQTDVIDPTAWPDVDIFWGTDKGFGVWRRSIKEVRAALAAVPDATYGNKLERLNVLHRQNFWAANPVPLDITVTKKPSFTRQHDADCDFHPSPPPNATSLKVTMYCPNIGRRSNPKANPPEQWENGLGGWLAWALAAKPNAAKSITRMTCTIEVPPPPISTADPKQLLYVFPGLQALKAPAKKKPGILQPILQWGKSPVLGGIGGDQWHVGSWFVAGGQPWETIQPWQLGTPTALAAATKHLTCDIRQIASSGGMSDYVCTIKDTQNGIDYPGLTLLRVASFDLAVVALECYAVDSCDDLPASGSVKITDIALQCDNNPWLNPVWVPDKTSPDPISGCVYQAFPTSQGNGVFTVEIRKV